MKKGLTLLFAAVLFLHTSIEAALISYSFSGVGSGQMGDDSFHDADFLIRLLGDTANIYTLDEDIRTLRGALSIHIDGLGDARFTMATRVFMNERGDNGGFTGPVVGFSDDRNRDRGSDFFDVFSPALRGYQLLGQIGSITSDDITAVEQFTDAATTRGLLSFDKINTVTFTSSDNAAVIPLPLASISGASLAGLLGLCCVIRSVRARCRNKFLPA